MDVRMFTVGPVAENCFIFRRDGSSEALIVDPRVAVIGAGVAFPAIADQRDDAASLATRKHLGHEQERSPDIGPGGPSDAASQTGPDEAHRRDRRGIRYLQHAVDDVR